MSDVAYSEETKSTYENFIAVCPHCQYKNIFNRVTDLNDVHPISYKEVRCSSENCKRNFNINGDLISPVYKKLIFDCYSLMKEKRYSYCILNLAQSFEVFFSLYLRVELLYKPFATERDNLEKLNRLSSLLFETVQNFAYAKTRNIFIRTVLTDQSIGNFNDSEVFIAGIDNLKTEPPDSLINGERNEKLRSLLMKLKYSEVPRLRNKVVHKQAYRPTLPEVETAMEETRKIIFGLSSCLDVQVDNISRYTRKA